MSPCTQLKHTGGVGVYFRPFSASALTAGDWSASRSG